MILQKEELRSGINKKHYDNESQSINQETQRYLQDSQKERAHLCNKQEKSQVQAETGII